MSSLKKLLAPSKKEVLVGEIVQRQLGDIYKVKIGKRTLSVRSLVAERLSKSSQVVVVKTADGLFITNKEQIKDRRKLEVTIDG
ncbi:MAG: hypothetical protein KAU17_08040 [Spirochaetales bacterium]|nr:hypothetical protein [Spirochaetales bacterium]